MSEAPGAAPQAKAPPFEHLSRKRVRVIVNCLTESTFFYRDDDRDHFDYLRRHRAEFERFFSQWFDFDLHVDRKCARLFRRRHHNAALTPKQRHLFDLTRRDECILFMLLLEFHERELAAQNVHYEHDEDVNFVLADFVEHAVTAFRRHLGEASPTDREVFQNIQSLFRELERHRFLRLREKDASLDTVAIDHADRLLYTFLPGLHCYDPDRLNDAVFRRAYGHESPDPLDSTASTDSIGESPPLASNATEGSTEGSPEAEEAAS